MYCSMLEYITVLVLCSDCKHNFRLILGRCLHLLLYSEVYTRFIVPLKVEVLHELATRQTITCTPFLKKTSTTFSTVT